MKTTKTAQYAAVAVKTSCLFAFVDKDIAVAKRNAKIKVIEAIHSVDKSMVRNRYIGMRSSAIEQTEMMILTNVPSRSAE